MKNQPDKYNAVPSDAPDIAAWVLAALLFCCVVILLAGAVGVMWRWVS
jgi:hypothetical protein